MANDPGGWRQNPVHLAYGRSAWATSTPTPLLPARNLVPKFHGNTEPHGTYNGNGGRGGDSLPLQESRFWNVAKLSQRPPRSDCSSESEREGEGSFRPEEEDNGFYVRV